MPRRKKSAVVPETIIEEKIEEVKAAPPEVKTEKTIKVKKPRKVNPWIVHTKKVQAENPGVSYREILKLAKTTYKKE